MFVRHVMANIASGMFLMVQMISLAQPHQIKIHGWRGLIGCIARHVRGAARLPGMLARTKVYTMSLSQYAEQTEPEYCPLCGGGAVIQMPHPIPEKFRPFVRELLGPPIVNEPNPNWDIIGCACCVYNMWDQPASIEQYAWAFNDVTACYLNIATDQQWFRVCVTQSDLPDGDVVRKWATHFGLSLDHIAW